MTKKLLFTFGMVAAAGLAHAQITLNSGDIAQIGKVIKQANDTTPAPSIVPGPAGASVTWNFTALASDVIDTLIFTNPSWTPYASQFTSSNLAVQFGSSGQYAYATNTSSNFSINGQAAMFGSSTVVIPMSPSEVLITWPSTYNTSFNNNSGYDTKFPFTQQPGIDSVRVKHTQSKSSVINAWGTVTTPLLSNQPCLRQRNYMTSTDTLWAHIVFPPGWQMLQSSMDTTVHFAWWASGIGFPLVEMDSMMNGSIGGVTWLMAQPTNSGVHEYATLNPIRIYPNPATDMIWFNLQDVDAQRVIVIDMTGREVADQQVSSGIESMSTTGFAPGGYLFTVVGESGQVLGRGKFNVIK
jgi:hypothetical protein